MKLGIEIKDIDQLIYELTKIRKEWGNLPVKTDYYDYGISTETKLSVLDLYVELDKDMGRYATNKYLSIF